MRTLCAVVEGVQAHPQKFWFVENPGKIRENLVNIPENPNKIPKYLGKIPENLGKNGAPVLQKNKWRPFIWRSHHENGRQKLHNFLGKLGQKSFAPAKICFFLNTRVKDRHLRVWPLLAPPPCVHQLWFIVCGVGAKALHINASYLPLVTHSFIGPTAMKLRQNRH